jgi:hypothetical protein
MYCISVAHNHPGARKPPTSCIVPALVGACVQEVPQASGWLADAKASTVLGVILQHCQRHEAQAV